jgi:hypothetical protein
MRARLPPARKKKKNQLEGVPTIYSYLLAARNVAETVRVVRLIRSFEEPLWATRPEYREAQKRDPKVLRLKAHPWSTPDIFEIYGRRRKKIKQSPRSRSAKMVQRFQNKLPDLRVLRNEVVLNVVYCTRTRSDLHHTYTYYAL